jgi:uncharacterized protein YkwD
LRPGPVRAVVIDAAGGRPGPCPSIQRVVLGLSLACAFALQAAGDAAAFTLKLAFPDGQPMTYGSGCAGVDCLDSGSGVARTDAAGEIVLAGRPRTIEYRRDGITLSAQVPPGAASGTLTTLGDRATVVLPRMMTGSSPDLDASESDLVARINEARSAQGLAPAQLNGRLSASADLQAAWLARSGLTMDHADLMHVGPWQTTVAFRLGEVSFPNAIAGAEVAEIGGTPAQAVSDWMASPPHRELLLARGPMLIGTAQIASFIVVDLHPACAGCEQAGTGHRSTGAALPPAALALAPPTIAAAATTGGSAPASARSCGRERLRIRRRANVRRRVRLSVQTQCLRRGSAYELRIRQDATGRVLVTRRIASAGAVRLRLHPTSKARTLRIELIRDGRAIVANSMPLRR